MTETGATKQGKIAIEIFKERDRQTEKWGKQEHSTVEWIAILTEEVGEAAKEAVDYHFINSYDKRISVVEAQSQRLINYRKELIQVMAVAMQMVEDLDERY